MQGRSGLVDLELYDCAVLEQVRRDVESRDVRRGDARAVQQLAAEILPNANLASRAAGALDDITRAATTAALSGR